MPEVSVNITAGRDMIARPVIHELSKRFAVETNILAASINNDNAFISFRISGKKNVLRETLTWLAGLDLTLEASDDNPCALLQEVLAHTDEAPAVEPPSAEVPENAITCMLHMTTPKGVLGEPIAFELGHRFNIVTNIKAASVGQEIGLLSLEVIGQADVIDTACQWLDERGVTVERACED